MSGNEDREWKRKEEEEEEEDEEEKEQEAEETWRSRYLQTSNENDAKFIPQVIEEKKLAPPAP